MTKAILIVDMPSCCTHCKFCNDETGFCTVLSKWVNNVSNTRDYYCPLKPMPYIVDDMLDEDDNHTGYEEGYNDGYNQCLDEIIGEEE